MIYNIHQEMLLHLPIACYRQYIGVNYGKRLDTSVTDPHQKANNITTPVSGEAFNLASIPGGAVKFDMTVGGGYTSQAYDGRSQQLGPVIAISIDINHKAKGPTKSEATSSSHQLAAYRGSYLLLATKVGLNMPF